MRGCASVVLTAVLSGAAPASAQTPSAEDLTSRAAKYVATFFDHFANVVSEERYKQDVAPVLSSSSVLIGGRGRAAGSNLTATTAHRELKSDFLLVTLPQSSNLVPFRDTFEVDGREVRDRQDRLTKLFLKPSDNSLSLAQAIATESARYNIGNLQRTVNDPVLAMAFLQSINQDRLTFTIDKADPTAGPDVWILGYRESAKPTFIRGPYDRDMPVHGQYWIESASGRIVRSELVIQDPTVIARITTSFRMDDRFKVDVPAEMREEYTVGGSVVSGQATYGRFRRFAVDTDETMKK